MTNLASDVKDYVELKFEYAKIEAAEKATHLISSVVVFLFAVILGAAIMAFVSFTLAFILAQKVGIAIAFGIISVCYVLLFVALFALRRRYIEEPVARFFGNLISANKKAGPEPAFLFGSCRLLSAAGNVYTGSSNVKRPIFAVLNS